MATIPVLVCLSGAAYLTCGAPPTGGLGALTVEGWFRPLALSLGNRPCVLKYGSTGKDWALYGTRDGRVWCAVFGSGGVAAAYSLPGAFAWGPWVHVAGTFDGTRCRVWVNGADVTFASRAATGTTPTSAEPVRVGGYIQDASLGYVGRLGWGRISQALRLPGTVSGPESYPVVDGDTLAQWHMSEGTGSTVDNAEGTPDYDGTLVNATWGVSATGRTVRSGRAVTPITGRRVAGAVRV